MLEGCTVFKMLLKSCTLTASLLSKSDTSLDSRTAKIGAMSLSVHIFTASL